MFFAESAILYTCSQQRSPCWGPRAMSWTGCGHFPPRYLAREYPSRSMTHPGPRCTLHSRPRTEYRGAMHRGVLMGALPPQFLLLHPRVHSPPPAQTARLAEPLSDPRIVSPPPFYYAKPRALAHPSLIIRPRKIGPRLDRRALVPTTTPTSTHHCHDFPRAMGIFMRTLAHPSHISARRSDGTSPHHGMFPTTTTLTSILHCQNPLPDDSHHTALCSHHTALCSRHTALSTPHTALSTHHTALCSPHTALCLHQTALC